MLEEARTTRRTLIQLAAVLIAPVVACSGDRPAGPDPLASCGDRATQITLAVGQYVSVDPASDSGCVTFPANAAADSAEYLVVPQSVAGASGRTATFQLRGGAVGATPTPGLDSADLDTLKQVFDSRLYPLDTTAFGGVSDIDANTVVIVLMTGVVNKLVPRSSQCASASFVAGFFFPGDLDPAFASRFNQGEIFYSIVADSTGTLSCPHTATEVKRQTPSTFTHEFQHMINFVQHVLVRRGQSEEGWLDEGLSKYAEELAGRSYLPGDPATFTRYAIDPVYDAYQYLSATGSYPLEIPEDTGKIGEIGASWLFTRYLVDQFGDSLPHRLVNSALSGPANVASQTGQPFATSLTNWPLANRLSDLPGFTTPPQLRYTSWHFRTTYQSLHSQDPGDFLLPFPLVPKASSGDAITLSGVLQSGSGLYQRALQRGGAAGFGLLFAGAGGAPLPPAVAARLNIIRIR